MKSKNIIIFLIVFLQTSLLYAENSRTRISIESLKVLEGVLGSDFQENLSVPISKCQVGSNVVGPCEDLFQNVCLDSNYNKKEMVGLEQGEEDLAKILGDFFDTVEQEENKDSSVCKEFDEVISPYGMTINNCDIKYNFMKDRPTDGYISFDSASEKEWAKLLEDINKRLAVYKKSKKEADLSGVLIAISNLYANYKKTVRKPLYELHPERLLNDYYSFCKGLEGWPLDGYNYYKRVRKEYCNKKKLAEVNKNFHLMVAGKKTSIEFVNDYSNIFERKFDLVESNEKRVLLNEFINSDFVFVGEEGLNRSALSNDLFRDYSEKLRDIILKSVTLKEKLKVAIYGDDSFSDIRSDFNDVKRIYLEELLKVFGDRDLDRQDVVNAFIVDFRSDKEIIGEQLDIIKLYDSRFKMRRGDPFLGRYLHSHDIADFNSLNATAFENGGDGAFIYLRPIFVTSYKHNDLALCKVFIHELQHLFNPVNIEKRLKGSIKKAYEKWMVCMEKNGIKKGQMEEAFSDWMAVNVVAKFIQKKRGRKVEAVNNLKLALSPFCSLAKKYIYKEQIKDEHPLALLRMNIIAATNPTVRSIFGCKEKDAIFEYCSFETEVSK